MQNDKKKLFKLWKAWKGSTAFWEEKIKFSVFPNHLCGFSQVFHMICFRKFNDKFNINFPVTNAIFFSFISFHKLGIYQEGKLKFTSEENRISYTHFIIAVKSFYGKVIFTKFYKVEFTFQFIQWHMMFVLKFMIIFVEILFGIVNDMFALCYLWCVFFFYFIQKNLNESINQSRQVLDSDNDRVMFD